MLLQRFWLETENLSISYQSSGPYTGFQLHLGLLLVYKSLNCLEPQYIADMLTEYISNRPIRSLGSSQLEIPRDHSKQDEYIYKKTKRKKKNLLLVIMPPTSGTSFQKRLDVLKQ